MTAVLDPRVCDPSCTLDAKWFRASGGAGWTDGRLIVWGLGLVIPPEFEHLDATNDLSDRAEELLAVPSSGAREIDLRDLALFSLARTPRDCVLYQTHEGGGVWLLPQDACSFGGWSFDRRLIAQMVAGLAALKANLHLLAHMKRHAGGAVLWIGDRDRRALLMSLAPGEATRGLSFEEMVGYG